ncbi:hypothetical protein [Nocardioides sp. SYSU DS0663]|uniref:hypothetical protein n=1 Tax=Nocardioides sp. SYSU DS0663 TaxID=3416445 RepID=UPI003F4C75D4
MAIIDADRIESPGFTLHGAEVHSGRPAGVRVDRKGAAPDLVVPSTPFLLPAGQLAEEIDVRVRR